MGLSLGYELVMRELCLVLEVDGVGRRYNIAAVLKIDKRGAILRLHARSRENMRQLLQLGVFGRHSRL